MKENCINEKGVVAIRDTSKDDEKVVVIETLSTRVMAPKVVYKYRDYSNEFHRRLLSHQELYLASPLSFEDVHDCSLEYEVPAKRELFDFYRRHLPAKLLNAPRHEQRRYAKMMAKEGLLTNPEEERKVQRKIDERHFLRFGVLSLSKKYDIDYMWERYGNNHKGFCVGFDTKTLCNSGLFGGGGDVVYYDELPFLHVDDNVDERIAKSIFSKLRIPYEQEQEYRLTKSWQHEATDADRTKVVPPDSIVSIVLGRDMEEGVKNEIKEIQANLYGAASLTEL